MPSARKKSNKSSSSRDKAAADRYVKGLLTRGEAAPEVDGKLPPGATHAIVGTDEAGNPVVKRRRFSAF